MLPIDAPPGDGRLSFQVLTAPVSLQAPSAKKAAIVTAIRAVVSKCEYLLCGDVKVAIEWGISERARYQTDASADVDNIAKPILDALSGPDGIMIDDCQVQELTCYWAGGYASPSEERIAIEIRFEPDAYVFKAGLLFLNVSNALYFPIHDDAAPRAVLRLAEHVMERFRHAAELQSLEHGEVLAHAHLPSQRVFHRSKVTTFRLTSLEDLKTRLGSPN